MVHFNKVPVEKKSQNENIDNTTKDFDVNMLYDSDSETQSSSLSSWSQELNFYLSHKRAGKNTNILDWWKQNQNTYPSLSKMARDFLCTPATSVPSERLFSRSSLVIRKHRNKLSDNSITQLMCLNSWVQCSLAEELKLELKEDNKQ